MTELSEEAKEQRKLYQREYRRKHPEKQKEYTRRYWEKKGGKDNISCEEANMIKCTMNIEITGETLEDIGEQVRRFFPETKMSAMETDHSTHSDTDSISQFAQEVQEDYSQLDIFQLRNTDEIEEINQILAPYEIALSASGDKSTYKIGCVAVIVRWYRECDGDTKKFLEPIRIVLDIYDAPNDNRFDGRIMRTLIKHVTDNYGHYYHNVYCKNLASLAPTPETLIGMIKDSKEVAV